MNKALTVIAMVLAIIPLALLAVDAQVPQRRDFPSDREARPEATPPGTHRTLPTMDSKATEGEFIPGLFGSDPTYPDKPYDADAQLSIYGGKTHFDAPRPVLEWGYPLYGDGPIGAGHNMIGEKNLVRPQLLVYGDWRTAIAYNDNGTNEVGQVATRLNVDVDLKLTATERIHAFFRPLDQGGQFTRYEFAGDDRRQGDRKIDGNLETLFFEGDIGAIAAGLTDSYVGFDLPVAFGLVPLFFQNGIWVDDAFVGGALAIPALNSPMLDISNLDVSFFMGVDKVSTLALKDARGKLDDDAGRVFGVAAFSEMRSGYLETGYGYLQDTRDAPFGGFDYHSVTAAWTQRYGGWLSNSLRAIGNFGQSPDRNARQTADGWVFIAENSLVTALPSTLVPYVNIFAGFDRPQSLAHGGDGVLKNVGINFETDALTGFPKLNDTAQDAYGGAIGLQYLFALDKQIVVEVSTVQPWGGSSADIRGDQYGFGVRHQMNLTDRWIFRTDAILGKRDRDDDLFGVRMELRRKF